MASIDASNIRFPITLDEADDLIFTSADVKKIKHSPISFSRIAAIASALQMKRDYVLRLQRETEDDDLDDEGDCWGISSPTLENHLDVVLFVDKEDLERHEKPSKHGRTLVETIREICNAENAQDRTKNKNIINSRLSALNKHIFHPKTGGAYRLSFRDNCIAVVGNMDNNFTLRIGNKEYPVLVPRGRKGEFLDYGFATRDLKQIAGADLTGISPSDIGLEKRSAESIRARASATNRAFANLGFPSLGISFVGGLLYLFDYMQPTHVEKRNDLHAETKRTVTRGPGNKTIAEHLTKISAAANDAKHGHKPVFKRPPKTRDKANDSAFSNKL